MSTPPKEKPVTLGQGVVEIEDPDDRLRVQVPHQTPFQHRPQRVFLLQEQEDQHTTFLLLEQPPLSSNQQFHFQGQKKIEAKRATLLPSSPSSQYHLELPSNQALQVPHQHSLTPPPVTDSRYLHQSVQQYQKPNKEYKQRIIQEQDLQLQEECEGEDENEDGDGSLTPQFSRAPTSFSTTELPQKSESRVSFSVKRSAGGPFSLKRATSFSLGKGSSLNFRRQSSFSWGRRSSTLKRMRKGGGSGSYSHVTPSLVPSESPSKISQPVGYVPKGKYTSFI